MQSTKMNETKKRKRKDLPFRIEFGFEQPIKHCANREMFSSSFFLFWFVVCVIGLSLSFVQEKERDREKKCVVLLGKMAV